jgi:hypothetical protein
MKNANILFLILVVYIITPLNAHSQSNWKLTKDKDGIKVFQKEVRGSVYKTIKVECTLTGNFDKMMAVINNVGLQNQWVYNNKKSILLKRVSPVEMYYYSETTLPWPVSNRDAIIHLIMYRDSLDRFLNITVTGIPDYIPAKEGLVRVPKSNISWHVTVPETNKLFIVYTFDADPGGSIPAWLVNSFADKGPYESFKKFGELLKK